MILWFTLANGFGKKIKGIFFPIIGTHISFCDFVSISSIFYKCSWYVFSLAFLLFYFSCHIQPQFIFKMKLKFKERKERTRTPKKKKNWCLQKLVLMIWYPLTKIKPHDQSFVKKREKKTSFLHQFYKNIRKFKEASLIVLSNFHIKL